MIHTWFQREWLDHVIYNQRPLLLGPRDHGKSQWTSYLLPAWALLNNRNLRMACFSATKDKAKKWAINTRRILERKSIIHLFGEFKGDDWLKMEFSVSDRATDVTEPSMIAFGVDSGVTSFHPDLLILDDVVDLEHFRFAEKRERLREFVSMTLKPALEPWTQQITVGTRYHPEDYYGELVEAGHPVNQGTNRCFLDDPEKEIEEMSQPLWPEKFSVEFLQEQYTEMGESAFSLQYFNSTTAMAGKIWRGELICRTSDQFEGDCYIGVDTAYRAAVVNDESAICVVRKCRNTGLLIIENCIGGNWGSDVLQKKIEEQYERFAARMIIIEDWTKNKKAMRDRFFLVDKLRSKLLPVKTTRPRADKISRYYAILPLWEAGQVLHRPGLKKLERQMVSVPSAKHDDFIDAMEIAISWHMKMGKAKKKGNQGGRLN
jgi:predicted phage terminase large subunit-like protein